MTIWTPRLSTDSKILYEAVADSIGEDIAAGILKPGERLPTQRDLAKRLAVTIGTVGRAYALAEKRGLISLEVGRGSFVRSFDSIQEEPGLPAVIDLGLNLPPATDQQELFAKTLAQLSHSRNIGTFFASAPVESWLQHRVAAAKWMETRMACSPDELLICSGTQNALIAALATLTTPGDSVLVEELTFPGMIAAARLLHLNLVPVAMDDQGIIPEELERAAKKAAVLYCVPVNQNPTTATMSKSRREEIAGVAAKKKLSVIEDDVYGRLVEAAPPPIARWIPDQTFLVSSLAKTLAVGLRLAFVRVPSSHREMMIANMRASSFFAPPLLCEIAANWIDDGTALRFLHEIRQTARRRQQIAREVLGQLSFRADPCGNHVWLQLPDGWSAETLQRAAGENGVGLYSAAAFVLPGSPAPNAVRLALGPPRNESELRNGLNVVARLLNERSEGLSAKY